MGAPMAGQILKGGVKLTVFDVECGQVQTLVDAGAGAAASPKELGAASDIVVCSLPHPDVLKEVVLGDDGLIHGMGAGGVVLPTGCSLFPEEIVALPRSWAERTYRNIGYWNELDKGGHFAAFEQPELFVNELRKCFRLVR